MWFYIAGAWVIGCAVFYTYMVRSAKPLEDDFCSRCEKKDCCGCESCVLIQEHTRKAA